MSAIYPGASGFNYYIDSTTAFTISGAYQTPFVSWETNFVPGTSQADSNIIWVTADNEYGCATLARGKVVVHRLDFGIYITQPFTSYYHVNADNHCQAVVNYQAPSGSDYCGDYVYATQLSGLPSGVNFPVGRSLAVYSLKNFYGDSTIVTITIDVQDVTPPIIVSVPSSDTLNASPGLCSAVYTNMPAATAVDNCSGIVTASFYWSGLLSNDSVFGVGTTQLYYTFADSSGNKVYSNPVVTVIDNQPPVIHCPADMVYYVGPGDTAVFVGYNAPYATDNCDTSGGGMIPWEVSGFPQFGYHGIGTTTQVWADTDKVGNMGTCQFNISVKDTMAPVLTCPGPLYFLADTGYDYTHITYTTPTAIDILGSPVTYSLLSGKASGDTASIGVYTSIWEGTDMYGNIGTCPVKITVSNNQAPDLICPHSITTQNDSGLCTATIGYSIALAHDVDGNYYNPVLYQGYDSGYAFPFGTTTVIYTATDNEGNRAFCSFDVTVKDTIAPRFTSPCPNDTTLNLNPAVCGAQLSPPVLTGISYDCAPPSIGIWSGNSNHFFTLGTTTQQYRIVDDHGNYNICQYNVTVVDNNHLTVTCPSDYTQNNDPGKCTAYIPSYGGSPIITPYYSQQCMSATLSAPLAPNAPTFLIGYYPGNLHCYCQRANSKL